MSFLLHLNFLRKQALSAQLQRKQRSKGKRQQLETLYSTNQILTLSVKAPKISERIQETSQPKLLESQTLSILPNDDLYSPSIHHITELSHFDFC